MANVLTRADWNDLLQFFNDARTDCSWYGDTEPVGEKHKWSKMDVLFLREYLLYITKKVTVLETLFTRWKAEVDHFWATLEFPVDLVKWKQDIMDEFNLVRANYECKCTEAMAQDVIDLDGTAAYAPHQFSSTFVYDHTFAGYDFWKYTANWSFAECEGEEFGFAGVQGYTLDSELQARFSYTIEGLPYQVDKTSSMGDLTFDCDGIVEAPAPVGTYTTSITTDIGTTPSIVSEARVQTWESSTAACC
jgi:hypothetical protein